MSVHSVVVLLLMFLLIHVTRSRVKPCSQITDIGQINGLDLSVECTNSSAKVSWKRTDDRVLLAIKPYAAVEYTCLNALTGQNITTNIVYNREITTEPDSKHITDTNLDNCIFRACVKLTYVGEYKWNSDTAKCQEALDSTSSMSQSMTTTIIIQEEQSAKTMLGSSSLTINTSPQPTQSTTSWPSSPSINYSVSTTSSAVLSSPSITTTTDERNVIENSTVIIVVVIIVLVLLISITVLMAECCHSYWRWLKMTTTKRYEYKVKDEDEELPYDHKIRSVSIYSIDNISTTGSNVTVLHSLTIKCPEYKEKINEINIEKGANIRNLHLNNNAYQTNQSKEELDYTSDCSTESPETDIKYVNTIHKCLESPVISVEARVEESGSITSSFDRNGQLDNDGYLQDSNSSESHGYLQENNSSETFAAQILSHEKRSSPVCDDYIPDSSSDNQKDPTYLPSCLIGHCESSSDSAYVSGTSTSSGTNTGYLTSTFVEANDILSNTEIHHESNTKVVNHGYASFSSFSSDMFNSYDAIDSKFVDTEVDSCYHGYNAADDSNNYLPNAMVENYQVFIGDTNYVCSTDKQQKPFLPRDTSNNILNTCDNKVLRMVDNHNENRIPDELELCDHSNISYNLPHNNQISNNNIRCSSNPPHPPNNESDYIVTIESPSTNSIYDTECEEIEDYDYDHCGSFYYEELELDLCDESMTQNDTPHNNTNTEYISPNKLHSLCGGQLLTQTRTEINPVVFDK